MDFLQPVVDVFNFILSILSTIIDGITGITSILLSIFNLILSICRILPNPLYPCFMLFISLYSTIFVYKIVRKG